MFKVLKCFFFLFIPFFGATALADSRPLPKLTIASPSFDFGSVKQGEKVVHDFPISNTGTAPLVIQKLQPTCGCTAGLPEKSVLAPGENSTIHVTFDTAGFTGYKVKSVRVFTNDSANSSALLSLQGNIRTDIELKPESLYFGKVAKGSKKALTATVLVEKAAKLNIGDISAKSEFLKLEVKEISTGSQSGKQISVMLADNIPVGIFRDRIVVRTSSKENPVIAIPIFARVEGDLKLTPADISFGLLKGPLRERITQVVEVVNQGEQPIQILSVNSNNPLLKPMTRVLEQGKRFEITVAIEEGTVGMLRGELEVITDHPEPEQTRHKLPVYGIVTAKGP